MAKRGPKPPPTPAEPYEGLLSGYKWGTEVSYSFPNSATDYGRGYSEAKKFEAFLPGEQQLFETVIDQVKSFSNLSLIPLTGTQEDGTADIRIGKTITPGADAWAYYPGSGKGGDAWFDKGLNGSFGGKGGMNWDAIEPGDYTYTVFMHEFGHTLGLKHSFESGGLFGAVPKQYDSLEYTVMSYDAYQDGSSTVDQRNWWADDGNNPQTFMMLDIAALQSMYGADYSFNSGATTYQWMSDGAYSIDGGQNFNDLNVETNVIFMTVWDGGGEDTYSFSNYTDPAVGIKIDLNPGGWVTIDYSNTVNPTQRADLLAGTGEYWATGNIANALLYGDNTASLIENAIGGAGNDILIGNQVSNTLTGGGGGDTFVFNKAFSATNVDVITDFDPAFDSIWLDVSIFAEFTGQGIIEADAFWLGSDSHDADDRIIYNELTGYLYYDADGLGGTDPLHFASLSTIPSGVTYSDFLYGSDLLIA